MDDEVRRCWDDNADVWARHVRAGYDTYRDLYNNPAFIEFVGDLGTEAVLDAGCGEGFNTRLLAHRGAQMTGVDISARMIELAQTEEDHQPLGIRYEVASMSDLSVFADDTFDAVVSTLALMDCPDYEGAIREFWRVLCPQGMLAFSTIHPCFSYWLVREWEYDESGQPVAVRLGSYFQEIVHGAEWTFGAAPDRDEVEPFRTLYFHRTLASYFNALCNVGFCLEAVAEPRPTEAACRAEPRLRKHRLVVPGTLCVKARKEAV